MGWVTLSLRKRELKQEHQYYQLRDLQISREKRQLARSKSYQMAKIQSEQSAALKEPKTAYQTLREQLMNDIRALYGGNNSTPADGTNNTSNGANYQPGTTDTTSAEQTGVQSSVGTSSVDTGKLYALQQDLANAQTNYQEEVNAIKDYYDAEKSMLEEEVGDQETELEMEQVDVETQMEAISEELNAVSEAISNEIKSSTIKLA